MSQAELKANVLLILQNADQPSSSSSIMQIAREQWHVDDLDVREAIWALLESHQIELTPDRRLKAKLQHRVAV